MLLETIYTPSRLALAANSNASSFTTLVPTKTEPTTGVVQIGTAGTPVCFTQNSLLVNPFGTGSDTNTLSVRVTGWRPVGDGSVPTLWVPTVLCEVQATLDGSSPGVAGTLVPNTCLFAKTLTLTTGNANVSVELVSPAAAGEIAHFVLTAKGFQKFQFTFTTGSSATDCNALVAFL